MSNSDLYLTLRQQNEYNQKEFSSKKAKFEDENYSNLRSFVLLKKRLITVKIKPLIHILNLPS